jgi:hypothetical protein
MKTLLIALALAGTCTFQSVTASEPVAVPASIVEPVTAPVVAPDMPLAFESPVTETVAAPVVVEPEPVYVAPVTAPVVVSAVPAPKSVPVSPVAVAPSSGNIVSVEPTAVPVPVCQEDQPCWDCETMGNRICGPLPTEPAEPVTPDCANLKLGEAWAGVGLTCGLDKK